MSSSYQPKSRKYKARQKMSMQKIENDDKLQVSFSKRRYGLFKKASELSTLTGAQVGVIVFSPANKAYSFGHPNVQKVIEKFQMENPAPSEEQANLIFNAQDNVVTHCNSEVARIEALIELERKRGEELDQIRKTGQLQGWFPRPINELNKKELDELKVSLLKLQQDLKTHVQKDMSRVPTLEINKNLKSETSNPIDGPGFVFPFDSKLPVGPSHYIPPHGKRRVIFNTSMNPLGEGSTRSGLVAPVGNSSNIVPCGQAMEFTGNNVANKSQGSWSSNGREHF